MWFLLVPGGVAEVYGSRPHVCAPLPQSRGRSRRRRTDTSPALHRLLSRAHGGMRGDPRPPPRRPQPLALLPPFDAPAAAISSGTRIATRVQMDYSDPPGLLRRRAMPRTGSAAWKNIHST
ncbi:homeobox protein Hox-D4 isoform 5-T6 [Geothlypis trichas]